MKHRCLAPRCDAKITDRYLMCGRHWAMLPRVLQDEIWREYFYGQRHKKHPTDAYAEAVRKAIVFVDKERRAA